MARPRCFPPPPPLLHAVPTPRSTSRPFRPTAAGRSATARTVFVRLQCAQLVFERLHLLAVGYVHRRSAALGQRTVHVRLERARRVCRHGNTGCVVRPGAY